MHPRLIPDWREFLVDLSSRAHARDWFNHRGVAIYCRSSLRFIPPATEPRACFELANINVLTKGRGTFTQLLLVAEDIIFPQDKIMFIENVFEPRFQNFFTRRGYLPVPVLPSAGAEFSPPSFYKLPL